MSHTVSIYTVNNAIEENGILKAPLSPIGTGPLELIAGVPDMKIVPLAIHLVASLATVIKIQSGVTDLTGPMSLTQNQLIDIEAGTIPSLWTEDGEALNIDQTVDGVDGFIAYVLL